MPLHPPIAVTTAPPRAGNNSPIDAPCRPGRRWSPRFPVPGRFRGYADTTAGIMPPTRKKSTRHASPDPQGTPSANTRPHREEHAAAAATSNHRGRCVPVSHPPRRCPPALTKDPPRPTALAGG